MYRKLAYLGAMAAMVVPLSWLALPRTVDDAGGELAQLRDEFDLGQADLGEIDPASETMKLATLGLRGVAVNLLWQRANELKKTENWSELTATLDQLAKLQPNFVTFWKFQAWNQSYNLSVEFDDYRDRYYYVRRGIEFMEKGERYNRDNPQLLWELGWFIGYKIGRADEKVQYRRLFKADDEYHKTRPLNQRDNWLVGKQWYEQAVVAADDRGRGIGRKSPIVFYQQPAKWQMNYAAAIEDEGVFENAVEQWRVAEGEWRDFGARELQHSFGDKIQLNSSARLAEEIVELQQQLDALNPESEANLTAKLRETLTDEERAAIQKDPADWTEAEGTLAFDARIKLKVRPRQLAEQIGLDKPGLRREAQRIAAALEDASRRLRYTDSYKDTANYDYWLTRTEFEQTAAALEARELIFRADEAFTKDLMPEAAKPLYEQGFAKWREVLDAFPVLLDVDGTTGDDIFVHILDYHRVLEQLEEEIADDFPLWDIIRDFDAEADLRAELSAYEQRMREKSGAEADPAAADQPGGGPRPPTGAGPAG
ncbi:MAG: hypothetical protein AAF790_13350, partial [Planctomycetota bacterium]